MQQLYALELYLLRLTDRHSVSIFQNTTISAQIVSLLSTLILRTLPFTSEALILTQFRELVVLFVTWGPRWSCFVYITCHSHAHTRVMVWCRSLLFCSELLFTCLFQCKIVERHIICIIVLFCYHNWKYEVNGYA